MLHQNKENHIHAVKRVALRHSTSKSNTNTQYIIGYYSPSTNKDAQSNKIEAQEKNRAYKQEEACRALYLCEYGNCSHLKLWSIIVVLHLKETKNQVFVSGK